MAVPNFQSLMLPALRALADGAETPISEVRSRIANAERLTMEDLQETLSGGRQTVFTNRVSWALIHLGRAGLTKRARRGIWQLTVEGRELLADAPPRIDINLLRNYPTYVAWRTSKGTPPAVGDAATTQPGDSSVDTPEEALEKAVQHLTEALEAEVLQRIYEAPPSFLEKVVVHLLIAMGYGGGDPARGRVTGRSGDGGIDGTVREDPLGLDEVYVQAG